ncbi:MAG: hypothetical protein E7812_05970 [Phenylobacterium sp.]|nr:MAG: hypothetical protein E7812_05970 [Phenylobacterium sp.]
MRGVGRLILCVVLAYPVLAYPGAAAAQPDAKTRLLTQARAAYYSLNRQGFAGARCQATPDWAMVLGHPRSDPQFKSAFAILDALQFSISVNADGGATIDKKDSGAPRPAQTAASIQQLFAGLDQELTGLFSTWSLFAIKPATPDPTQAVTLTPRPGGYHLSYKDGDAAVDMDTSAQGEISRVDVRSAGFVSNILPRFQHDPTGWILTSYVADYVPANNGPGKTHLTVDITYQTINGMKFPSTVAVDTIYDGASAKNRVAFSDCQLTRK